MARIERLIDAHNNEIVKHFRGVGLLRMVITVYGVIRTEEALMTDSAIRLSRAELILNKALGVQANAKIV
jgi:hypothetical protein